jgi:hypothetical protein
MFSHYSAGFMTNFPSWEKYGDSQAPGVFMGTLTNICMGNPCSTFIFDTSTYKRHVETILSMKK